MSVEPDWNENNRGVIEEFRANGGKVGDEMNKMMLLTTTGAKSGLLRVNPLAYSVDGDRIIVIASKGASPTNPDWYHNLVANPEVTVEVGSERFQARASIAEGEELQRLFDQQAAQMPFFAEYQKQTTRQIPVIILERIT
jgi:deazaflavin-dependent oxidoreductase (nitroreductase family)